MGPRRLRNPSTEGLLSNGSSLVAKYLPIAGENSLRARNQLPGPETGFAEVTRDVFEPDLWAATHLSSR